MRTRPFPLSMVTPRGGLVRAALLLLLGSLTACGGDGGNGTTDPEETPEITIRISSTSESVQQGQSTTTTATVTRSGGFTGAVTVTVTGAPSGVTASVHDASTSGSTTTATITLDVAADASPGQYTLTVHASGSGVSAVTTSFSLTVTATPSFDLSVQPTALSIDQGDEGEATVTIARTNFTGDVTLTLEGAAAVAAPGGPAMAPLPTGVTGTFAPNATTGSTSTLTVTVDGAAQAGLHDLTIRAAATGLEDRTASLALTVNEVGTPPTIEVEPTEIAVGAAHACRLDDQGAAYCWGADFRGQLGDDATMANKAVPVAVAGGHTFEWIAASDNFTCALDTMGQAWCWGEDLFGQLGDGSPATNQPMPVAVSGGLTFIAITAGAQAACGLTAAGQAYCWGYDFYSQLGDGPPNANQFAPVAVGGGHTFSLVSASGFHMCALDLDGKAWCWGNDGYGELGDGAPVQGKNLPVPVAGGHTFVTLAAGSTHNCAIDDQGQTLCWGGDVFGELGDGAGAPDTCGSNPCSLEPVAVAGGHTFTSVMHGGGNHSCALEAAGNAFCWGLDDPWGTLGNDAALADQSSPVAVAGGHLFRELSSGPGNTCGVDMAGDAWCWGDDSVEQLGDGAGATKRATPVKVVDLP